MPQNQIPGFSAKGSGHLTAKSQNSVFFIFYPEIKGSVSLQKQTLSNFCHPKIKSPVTLVNIKTPEIDIFQFLTGGRVSVSYKMYEKTVQNMYLLKKRRRQPPNLGHVVDILLPPKAL